jgi:prepilin-type N-terminal cleavage/methylation domain-containing protein
MSTRARRAPEAGFTLVEVIFSLFLIGIAVLAAAPMFMYALRGNAAGADIGSAGALAVERMELLRVTAYGDLVAGGDLDSDAVGYSDTSIPGFDVRWRVQDGGGPGGVKTITVRAVSTRTTGGLPKQVDVTTLRAP